MKKIVRFPRIFLLVVCVVFISDACIKGPRCWGDDKNEGLIKEMVDMNCWPLNEDDGEGIFRNEKEYRAAFDTACVLPEIDFSEFSLLFQQTTGGCYSKHKRNVEVIEGEKRVHFRIQVNNCGACKRMGVYNHWVLVPKVPDDFTVSFEEVDK